MASLPSLMIDMKLAISKAFAYDNPFFLRGYGIRVVPVGARP